MNMSHHSKTSCVKMIAKTTYSFCIIKLATFFTYALHGLTKLDSTCLGNRFHLVSLSTSHEHNFQAQL